MSEIWLAVDKNGIETISAYEPNYDGFEWNDFHFSEEESDYTSTTIVLPKGFIKKLLGKELTLQDSPIRIEEE